MDAAFAPVTSTQVNEMTDSLRLAFLLENSKLHTSIIQTTQDVDAAVIIKYNTEGTPFGLFLPQNSIISVHLPSTHQSRRSYNHFEKISFKPLSSYQSVHSGPPIQKKQKSLPIAHCSVNPFLKILTNSTVAFLPQSLLSLRPLRKFFVPSPTR